MFSSQSSITRCKLVCVEWPLRYAYWSGEIKHVLPNMTQAGSALIVLLFGQCVQLPKLADNLTWYLRPIILINRGNRASFHSSGKVPYERESFMVHSKESTMYSPGIMTSFRSNPKVPMPAFSDKNIRSIVGSLRWTFVNLNVYILSCPLHNNELSPVNEELIKPGTFVKCMLKSSALISLELI